MHIIFFVYDGLGLYHAVPSGTSFSGTNYATLLHDDVWVVLHWEWPWPLLCGFVVWRTVPHVVTSAGFRVCCCDWEFLPLPSQSPDLPPCDIFPPLFWGSYWWDVGLNSQIPSVLSLWSQFADPGWPQGCIWSYIMLMEEVQGTFRRMCWIMGIWGCVRLCGSCRLIKFVRHINPVQET